MGDAAYPIGMERSISFDSVEVCSLFREDGEVTLRPHDGRETYVNGKSIQGNTIVACGDRVRIGPDSHDAKEIVLIRVVDNG